MKITERLSSAWNAFKGTDNLLPPSNEHIVYGPTRSSRLTYRPKQSRFASGIFTRIATDVAMTQFNHVKINAKNENREILDSGLNYCLTTEANADQSSIAFMYDIAYSLLDEGRIAVVPVETSVNPKKAGSYYVDKMRVGPILGTTNKSVHVRLYDENDGEYKNIWVPKKICAIIESPLYPVVNEPNSTLQRLLSKMSILDANDSAFPGSRLDIILQMPQAIRTDKQVEDAISRVKNIDRQLSQGANGIAYIDGTERVTQLNRPANSQISETIDKLKKEFYNQLGLTESIFDGTATESQIRNYLNRTVDPIIAFIIKEFERKFLTKEARKEGQAIEYYRNTLKLISSEQLVSLSDTLRRNEIATSNEIRDLIGMKRSNDSSADELSNPNIAEKNKNKGVASAARGEGEHTRDVPSNQNGSDSVSKNKEE